ncbi:MAG: DNA polymerase III subunit gamma/tau, partial [Erysipelotrichales bacterium]
STAKLLAKALNCTNIVDGKICDECENCKMVKENNHPDVIEIDAASNNGVDEVRDLIDKVKYAPIKGRKKVYIIDEVHMMTQGAFNALLKTLEEPPEHVVFILATTEQHKVLPTIKSRCQKFVFKKISDKDIVACMKNVLAQEEVPFEEGSLELIASLCDGGMRDALGMLEQVMIFSNNNINIDTVNDALDLVSSKRIDELFNIILSKDLKQSLDYINELSQESVDYKQVIDNLITMSTNRLIDNKVNKINNEENNFLLNLIEVLDDSLERLKFDNSKKLYLDLALIKAINFKGNNFAQATNEAVVQQPQIKQEAKVEVAPSAMVNQTPEPTLLEPEIQPTMNLEETVVEDINEKIVEEVKETSKAEENEIIEVENLIDEDELMNVLVQAKRDCLNDVKEKWSSLEKYLMNVNTRKNAGLLIEATPIAASQDAMIVMCDNQSNVQLINDSSNISSISNFLSEMFQDPKFCFAIERNDWINLKEKYVKLRQVNQLPKARSTLQDITFKKEEEEKVVEQDELLVFGKKHFKEKLVVKREDDNNGY